MQSRIMKLTVAVLIAIMTVAVLGSVPPGIRDAAVVAACCSLIMVLYSRLVVIAFDRLLSLPGLPSEDLPKSGEGEIRDVP
jgi:hypothetical protein